MSLAVPLVNMKSILFFDWLPQQARWASLAFLGFPTLILCENTLHGRDFKFFFFNFWTVWAMELQKAAEDKKNKENINYSHGFIVHKKRTWSICSHLNQTSLVNNAHLFPALQMICLVYCEFSLVP